MDSLTFIATIVKAVVWPVVASYSLWLFRSNLPSALNGLLSRLTLVKAAGVEFGFSRMLDDAEALLPPPTKTITVEGAKAELNIGHASVTVDKPNIEHDDTEKLLNAYEIGIGLPPAYIVTQAWLRFEEEVHLYLQSRGVFPEGRRKSSNLALSHLKDDGLFAPDEFAELSELGRLRNMVAHETNVSITRTDALRYNDIMNGLIERIRSKRFHTPSP